jgi:transcriptional regulator with XRE-family HTH domain
MMLISPKQAIEKLMSIGWSQSKIARYAGCTQPHISRVLSSQRNKCDYRIADKLRATIDNLKQYHEVLNE